MSRLGYAEGFDRRHTLDLHLVGSSVMAALILNVTVDEVTTANDRVKRMRLMNMR